MEIEERQRIREEEREEREAIRREKREEEREQRDSSRELSHKPANQMFSMNNFSTASNMDPSASSSGLILEEDLSSFTPVVDPTEEWLNTLDFSKQSVDGTSYV